MVALDNAGRDDSCRATTAVRCRDGTLAMLKLIGQPQYAEAATLAAWTAHRVPSPALLHSGVARYAEDVTHLLLAKAPVRRCPHPDAGRDQSGDAPADFRHVTPPVDVVSLSAFLQPRLQADIALERLRPS